jgi:hypothetical protein
VKHNSKNRGVASVIQKQGLESNGYPNLGAQNSNVEERNGVSKSLPASANGILTQLIASLHLQNRKWSQVW